MARDDAIRATYPEAGDVEVETALDNPADMQALADLWVGLYGVPHATWTIPVVTAEYPGLERGDSVRLVSARLDVPGGVLCRIDGVYVDRDSGVTELRLWHQRPT